MASTSTYTCGPCCGAWYCVDIGGGCPGEALFLNPADIADATITKCSGPYASEAAAAAFCPTTMETVCCGSLPQKMFAKFSNGTGNAACLNGLSIPVQFGVGGVTYGNISYPVFAVPGGCSWSGSVSGLTNKTGVYITCRSPTPNDWIIVLQNDGTSPSSSWALSYSGSLASFGVVSPCPTPYVGTWHLTGVLAADNTSFGAPPFWSGESIDVTFQTLP